MQLLALARQVVIHAAADALGPPGGPLAEYFAHAHYARVPLDKYIEVAGKGVHKRRQSEELRHQLFRLRAALEVDCELQAAQVRLVAHVGDFLHLAGLHQLRHLVHHGLGRGGIGQLIHLYDVRLRVVAPACPYAEAAAPGAVDLRHRRGVHYNLAACREIRRREGGHYVVLRVAHELDGSLAYLGEVEAAYLARHADGDAGVGRDEDVWERSRQQRRLLHGAVVVVDEIHRLLVYVPEYLVAYPGELRLGVARSGAGHVTRIHLAEVALRVHKRHEHRAIAL